MFKRQIGIAFAIGVVGTIALMQRPVASKNPTPVPMETKDAATTVVGNLLGSPSFAILVGAQGSSSMGSRVNTFVGCDQQAFKDIKGIGAYGLASATGNALVHVCSYSISNGGVAQDVQFVSGFPASSGSGYVCSPETPVSAKFHLGPNQFVSQGSGIGSLFTQVPGQSLCLKVFGAGDVGVNLSYAGF